MATPIMNLFPAWARAQAEAELTGDIAEEERLVDEMLAAPAADARDIAAKLIAICGWDDPGCFDGRRAAAVLAEARSLVVQP